MTQVKAVFGIGNPGPKYQNTRHNLGFMLIDCLAQKLSATSWTLCCQAMIAERHMGHQTILLIKPLTYVNLCGESLQKICRKYKIEHDSVLVVVDDVSLPLGQIRIRRRGSSGSHRGIESIINLLNTEELPRLRLGIGGAPVDDLAEYVLAKFDSDEKQIVDCMLQTGIDAVFTWIHRGIDVAMNKFNQSKTTVTNANSGARS